MLFHITPMFEDTTPLVKAVVNYMRNLTPEPQQQIVCKADLSPEVPHSIIEELYNPYPFICERYFYEWNHYGLHSWLLHATSFNHH